MMIANDARISLMLAKYWSKVGDQENLVVLEICCKGRNNSKAKWMKQERYFTFWMKHITSFTIFGGNKVSNAFTLLGSTSMPLCETL